MSWNQDKYKNQQAGILINKFSGVRPAHTIIQNGSSPVHTSQTSRFYIQLNSAHLGVEWVTQVILIKYYFR